MSDFPAHGHSDPRVPSRETCVTRYLIDRWAQDRPDQVYALFEDGSSWTYFELRERVVQLAAGLQELGVAQGEHVALWMPSDRDALLAFHAVNYLGAVFVPFNTAYKGALLEHVLNNSDARLLICHASLVARLNDVDRAKLEQLVVAGDFDGDAPLSVALWSDVVASRHQLQDPARPIEPWDSQSIIYTSGTTGPSKGVLSSYLHLYTNAGPDGWPFVRGDDRFLVNMPIFHIGGTGLPFNMLARGGSIALMENFSTETFWQFVRETECTVIFLLGVMATFLLKREPADTDRDHSVRLAFMVPLTESATEFHERFGIDVYSIFNMTEVSTPTFTEPNPTKLGTCGKPRPGVEVRLVDKNDCEVAVGEVGEMIVRTDRPWGMNSGYYKNPEATAEAWRNGWFHTGDAFRRDADGYFYFVDRVKDAIRRRGENISSFEVESQIAAHPSVREAAVIGVPSEFSEDEVMVVVAPVDGHTIELEVLFEFAAERLPYFMVPRYFRIMDELPKTPTAKVQKAKLREDGVTDDTWDRERAGLRLKREKF
ncbi:ATP-dependent acyl-CoA ligase [Altererythrobacter sp. BO-6]|uniref:AMP-binding protein n=1 Tax=Altererythrobacter sp. BO-6 TaxID=2604537 RepID=UPI0013E0F586|nr:AMP-binding protein [Altererythrobacter sp. BO-6]QIG54758.1 ATP-dependent acyl-CoA ligase [Altererythrobacter sp. BO-6]